MTDYGIVRSTVKPEHIKIDEYSVWVNTDIQPVEEEAFTGYSYHMVRYDKDEYIMRQQDMIEEQIINTQLALCELYESTEV